MSALTKQAIFDRVCKGLASQGFQQSLTPYGACAYRGDEDRRCAAGWILPDANFTEEMNSWALGDGPAKWKLFGITKQAHRNFLRRLQAAHDESLTPEEMREDLAAIGRRHRLRLPRSLTAVAR